MENQSSISSSGSEASSSGEQSQQPGQSAAEYMRELQSMRGEVESLKAEKNGLTAKFERVSKAFSDKDGGDDRADEDPDARFLDTYLEAALEDQKQGGKGLPLTTKLAMETAALKKQLREMQAELKRHGQRQDFMASPDTKYDTDAYSTIDMQVQEAVEGMYGEVPPHLFDAITKDISNEIKNLKKNNPEAWNQIRRNPEYLKRLGMHFVEKAIPPKARQMLQAEKERNTPMSMSEMRQAMKEADEIRDPQARGQIKEQIRQKLLEEMYNRR
jgi:hypothetical protein